uniref:Uncharacterized protein n=1 Tax=Mycena chlorophos TaxID=658473 RepID=A0ABQ0M549_MYCCL|nr:predicted protein [Mycena chlorophos]
MLLRVADGARRFVLSRTTFPERRNPQPDHVPYPTLPAGIFAQTGATLPAAPSCGLAVRLVPSTSCSPEFPRLASFAPLPSLKLHASVGREYPLRPHFAGPSSTRKKSSCRALLGTGTEYLGGRPARAHQTV